MARKTLQEGDRVRVAYGKSAGVEGAIRHIGNLFGDGQIASIDVGELPWREYQLKLLRRI